MSKKPNTDIIDVTQTLTATGGAEISLRKEEEAYTVGMYMGRIQALDFIATIATSAMLSVFENIKKSKGWRHITNPQNSDLSEFTSLEEFCEVKLGKSYKRLQELSSNMRTIGQEAFEQAEKLGLRQVDFNAIKSLPAKDRELVRRAVEDAKDRDEVVGLIQELASKYALEKQELEQNLEDSHTRNTNLEKNLTKEIRGQAAEIEILTNKLKAAKARAERLPFEFATVMVREETLAAQADVELAALAVRKMFDAVLAEPVAGLNSDETELRLGHVWMCAHAMLARMTMLVTDMQVIAQRQGVELPDQPRGEYLLTDEEASDWLQNWNTIQRTKEAEAFVREQARIDAAGRGRGRPAKGPKA